MYKAKNKVREVRLFPREAQNNPKQVKERLRIELEDGVAQ